jgi:hypothetical protein
MCEWGGGGGEDLISIGRLGWLKSNKPNNNMEVCRMTPIEIHKPATVHDTTLMVHHGDLEVEPGDVLHDGVVWVHVTEAEFSPNVSHPTRWVVTGCIGDSEYDIDPDSEVELTIVADTGVVEDEW